MLGDVVFRGPAKTPRSNFDVNPRPHKKMKVRANARVFWLMRFLANIDGSARLDGPAFQTIVYRTLGCFVALPKAKGKPNISKVCLHALLRQRLVNRVTETALRPASVFDDDVYYRPTAGEVHEVLSELARGNPHYRTDVFDCEDYAYRAKFFFSLHRWNQAQSKEPFAIGFARGIHLPNGGAASHCINIAVTSDEGILLLDTQPGSTQVTPLNHASAHLMIDYIVI